MAFVGCARNDVLVGSSFPKHERRHDVGGFHEFLCERGYFDERLVHLHIWLGGDVAEQSVTHRTVAASVFPQVDDEVADFVLRRAVNIESAKLSMRSTSLNSRKSMMATLFFLSIVNEYGLSEPDSGSAGLRLFASSTILPDM